MLESQTDVDSTRTKLIADLREIVGALDHRVPHVERVGERQIARDALLLRDKALKRIAELEKSATS